MLQFKGLYEWKLIEEGRVVQEGSQWNVNSDMFPTAAVGWILTSDRQTSLAADMYKGLIPYPALSDTILPSGVDFRRMAWADQLITPLTVNISNFNTGFDTTLKKIWGENVFTPSSSPRTIRIIGIRWYEAQRGWIANSFFCSFIELSTPITQNTNQYLYVKYTYFLSYSYGGHNTPSNRYIDGQMDRYLVSYYDPSTFYNCQYFQITPFLPPLSRDNLMRSVHSQYQFYYKTVSDDTSQVANGGYNRVLAIRRSKNFSESELVGPIGVTTFSCRTVYFDWTTGYSPVKDVAPSISRVFTHPASRISQIFSDPSYPPSSNGTIVTSGTPTNKYPIIARIKITKTGDASDIVDETFTADVETNELTVSQGDWAVNDIVKFTTDGILPSPLDDVTDYYLVSKTGSPPNVKIKVSLSQGGSEIDILTTGSGTHTIIRQNTGKFSLELEPWAYGAVKWNNASNENWFGAWQLPMGIDVEGKAMPHMLNTDMNEECPSTYNDRRFMVTGHVQFGEYIYSSQRSRYDGVENVCRWNIWTIETSQPLCKFGNNSTVVRKVVTDGTYIYFGTSDGIYKYDPASPTVSPSLMTIGGEGLIDNNIKDLAIDPVQQSGDYIMWVGHNTGLTKINLTSLSGLQYTSGTGQQLEGMSSNDTHILPGQLDVYNGRVLRGGGESGETNYVNYLATWVMDDGIGWYKSPAVPSGTCVACLRKGTNQILERFGTVAYRRSITVTGKGTGSYSVLESYSDLYNITIKAIQMTQVCDDTFVFGLNSPGFYGSSYGGIWTNVWKLGSAPILYSPVTFYKEGIDTFGLGAYDFASFRSPIDIGNGVYMFLKVPFFAHASSHGVVVYPFGWDGSAWVKDNTSERLIPRTSTVALLNGVSINFNNAVGKPWDQQFVAGERLTFVYAPYKIKDNLQTMLVRANNYFWAYDVVENEAVSIPVETPYDVVISKASDPDFRDIDPDDLAVLVKEGSTEYTKISQPARITYTADAVTDQLTVSQDISTGTPIEVYSDTLCPIPLLAHRIYYAIRIDSTHIKLAYTYAEALAGTAIDLLKVGIDTQYLSVITGLSTGTFFCGANGVFLFSAADAGKDLTISYTYSLFS